MSVLLPALRQRFFDANGVPLAGGKLYSYVAGTSTPIATYTDSSGLTPNTNPIVLDANGEAHVYIGSGYYKFILTDANDVVMWTEDNVKFNSGLGSADDATAAAAAAAAAAASETNAASSATAAAASATAAASSASSASTSATSATSSASSASTSATNAASSATSAASSATTATTQATNASNSATSAATSETNAANSATSAATSATNAANSATAAAAAIPSQTGNANKYLKTNGTATSWAQVDLTNGVTGALPIGNGGTGQITKAAAFDALSPMTTLGDVTYGGTSGTGTRLAPNTTTTKKYLAQTGNGSVSAAPAWSQPAFSELSGSVAASQMPALTGDATMSAGTTTTAISAATVTGKAITGFVSGAGTVAATDTILGAIQKIDGNANAKMTNPMTTGGDVIYGGASGAATRLANGSAGQVLTSNGTTTAPTWATPSSAPSSSYELSNLTLAGTVATNAMTIALKDSSGANPSAGSPVKIGFRSATAATGTYAQRSVTAALSVVIPSGTTIGTVSGADEYIYVYALDNASTVELAVSLTKFDEGSVQSTTAISTGASRTTLYSTTARTGVAIRLIGRLKSTQTTAGTWASGPSEISLAPFLAVRAPTVSVFGLTGTTTGYLFTTSAANATVGATYTNNTQTFTVTSTISGATLLFTSGAGAPAGSGTLTKATGTGDATITFFVATALATYTTPTAARWLRVRMVGGGGGGAGSGTGTSFGSGAAGGITAFSSLVAGGGSGGINASSAAGGTASGGDVNIVGGLGGGRLAIGAVMVGSAGGASVFGGQGCAGEANGGGGGAAAANSGGGGGTPGVSSSVNAGGSGAAGGYVEKILSGSSLAASFYYCVGGGGSGGGSGLSGVGGGAGGSGIIIVEEYYP